MNHFSPQKQTIVALTGMKVGHSTQQRLVGRQSLELPDAKQAVVEVRVSMAAKCASVTSKIQTPGGIIKPCGWEAFTTVGSSKTIWPGIDYVNSQHLAAPWFV